MRGSGDLSFERWWQEWGEQMASYVSHVPSVVAGIKDVARVAWDRSQDQSDLIPPEK